MKQEQYRDKRSTKINLQNLHYHTISTNFKNTSQPCHSQQANVAKSLFEPSRPPSHSAAFLSLSPVRLPYSLFHLQLLTITIVMKVPDQTFISDAFRNAIRFFLVIFVLEIVIRSCNIAMVFGMKPAAFVGPNKHLLLFVLEIVPFACWIGVTITMYTRLVERNCWKDFKGVCVMFLPIGFFSIMEV